MIQANWAAVYVGMPVIEYNKGNIENGNSDMTQATEYTKSFSEHANKVAKLLNEYNSKKN